MSLSLSKMIATAAFFAAITFPTSLTAQDASKPEIRTKPRITVNVDNGHWLDVRVYAVKENGAYDRIGTVTSFSRRRLELPNWMISSLSQVQLVADPIGSTQRYSAPPVIVSNGDVIEWKLANNLSMSSIWVRSG